LDERAVLGGHQAFGRGPLGALADVLGPLDPERLDRLIEIAVGFAQRVLAVEHSGTGEFPKPLDVGSGEVRHVHLPEGLILLQPRPLVLRGPLTVSPRPAPPAPPRRAAPRPPRPACRRRGRRPRGPAGPRRPPRRSPWSAAPPTGSRRRCPGS